MLYNSVVISNNTYAYQLYKFSNEELDDIKIEFDAFGYPVNDADDFCTYKGWLERAEE